MRVEEAGVVVPWTRAMKLPSERHISIHYAHNLILVKHFSLFRQNIALSYLTLGKVAAEIGVSINSNNRCISMDGT